MTPTNPVLVFLRALIGDPAAIRKGLAAGALTALAALGTALLDGALTGDELTAALGLGLGALVAVYAVPNAEAGRPRSAGRRHRRRRP